jgi:hypothetical protein
MADKLTSVDIPIPDRQSDLISKIVRDSLTNQKNKTNELVDEIAAAAIGTTNAETTAARPYHTNLKQRMDNMWSSVDNFIVSGGVVSINGGDAQKVDVTETYAKVNGIDAKGAAATSATVAFTSANTRLDVVVIQSDSTFTVVTGAESATPVLPDIAATQKALRVLTVGTASVTLSWDARDQGCWYKKDGVMKYEWKIQDAIDDLTAGGDIYVGNGSYYETLTYSYNNKFHYGSSAILYDATGNKHELNGNYYPLYKTLTANDFVKLINDSDTAKLDSVTGWGNIGGSETTFKSTSTTYVNCVQLTSNTVFIAYAYSTTGKSVIATITDNSISYGSEQEFHANTVTDVKSVMLSETSVLVCFDGTGGAQSIVATVSGTTISYAGSAAVFDASGARSSISATKLTAAKVFIGYSDDGTSGHGTGIVAEIAASVVTYGTGVRWNTVSTSTDISAVALSATSVFIAYDAGSDADCIISSISGTTVTYGAAVQFNGTAIAYTSCAKLSATKVLITFQDSSGSTYGECRIANISGTVITLGTNYAFTSVATLHINAYAQSHKYVNICYNDNDNNKGESVLATIDSEDVVTFSDPVEFKNGSTAWISHVPVLSRKVFIGYIDSSSDGEGIIMNLENRDLCIGAIAEDGTTANSRNVILKGGNIYYNFSALEIGERYYIDTDGSLTTTENDYPIGIAVSTTSILMI